MTPENVWDYPRPPRLEPVAAIVRIALAGRTIAESSAAKRVLETSHPPTYYLPRDAFRCDILPGRGRRSFCEWKGVATYWSFVAGDSRVEDCAWSYSEPTAPFAALRDHLAVYPSLMDACSVGDLPVAAQPGDFYGGWITPNLVGPFKGGPGTATW